MFFALVHHLEVPMVHPRDYMAHHDESNLSMELPRRTTPHISVLPRGHHNTCSCLPLHAAVYIAHSPFDSSCDQHVVLYFPC